MDGTNYEFNIQDEELDLLGGDDGAYNLTGSATPQYTPTNTQKGDDGVAIPAFDIDSIDLLADPETPDQAPNTVDPNAPEADAGGAGTPDGAAPGTEDKGTEEDKAPLDPEFIQGLADGLVDMGLFAPEEGEEKVTVSSTQELAERFQKSYQKGGDAYIQSKVGQYGPEYAEAWEMIFEKGLNPFEYFTREAQIASIEGLDVEDEEAQKQIVRTYFQRQGFPIEKVEAKIQKMIDSDDLADDAKEYKNIILAQEEKGKQAAALQAERTRQAEEQQRVEYGQSVYNVLQSKLKEKEYDGIPISDQEVNRAVDFIYTQKYQLPNGQLITEADRWWMEMKSNPALAAKFALMASNNFDTSKIQKKSVSKQNDAVFGNLTQKNKVAQRQAPTQTPSNKFFD